MAVIDPFRPLSRWHRVSAVLIGAFVLLYIASCLLTNGYGGPFLAIPIFVGFIAGLLHPKSPFMASLYAIALALSLSLVTRQDGVICILFALPILLPMLWIGAFVGSVVVRHVHTERACIADATSQRG
jgi:hypothetical protein